jgi:hypothetical protein
MKNLLITLSSLMLLYFGCGHARVRTTKMDSATVNQLKNDPKLPKNDDEVEPTFDEAKADLIKSYSEIKKIDTLIIDDKDSLAIHFKYYCLHDSSTIVPARYIAWKDEKKDFTANNFASKIIIIKNRDTIFNRIVYKKGFAPVVDEELKKYGVMVDAGFQGYEKVKGKLLFDYTVSIPMTDVGVPVFLTIDKKGNYAVHDEYYERD